MSVAVVIVNFKTAPLAAKCLESLRLEREAVPEMRVVIVDGGSGDGSAEMLGQLISDEPFRGWMNLVALDVNGGFGFANNVALAQLLAWEPRPEFILLLNPDAVVEPGAVAILVEYLRANPAVGAVGSQLLEPDGTVTGSAFPFPTLRGELARGAQTSQVSRLLRVPPPAFPSAAEDFEADWVTGASVMLRTDALLDSGLFDDGFFLYHEEIELMWRMRGRGWKICHEPRSRVRHVGGAATGVHSRPMRGARLPRRPSYWYESRRRFFALTRGRGAAAAAIFCWAVGHSICSLRRMMMLPTAAQPTASELFDHLRYGFPWRRDVRSGSTSWDAKRGDAPAWMSRRA